MWLHEVTTGYQVNLMDCDTRVLCADIFTKTFTLAPKWTHALLLINHPDAKDPEKLWNGLQRRNEPKTAAPSTNVIGDINRTIVEFCCGDDSQLGQKPK
jgi:hypothetical protein